MLQIKKILYTTDFSECANQAWPHALFLAKKYGARLEILHAIVLHGDYDPHNKAHHLPHIETFYSGIEKIATEKSDAILRSGDPGNVEITKVTKHGLAPAPVILDYAREQDIDLIVMGTQGRRGLGHLIMGSVAEEVVRKSECPVLTIGENGKLFSADQKAEIVVPLDFSWHSRNALVYAKHIAATYQAKLQLIHVIEETVHPSFYTTGRESIFNFMPKLKMNCETQINKIFQESEGPEVPFDIAVVEGRAAYEIIKFADNQKSSMIVMPTHGLTGIQYFLLGSVAGKVVRRAKCPVFTVKAFGKSLFER